MPLSADRCQVTWGPKPLMKRAEVGRGGSPVCVWVHISTSERGLSMCMYVHKIYEDCLCVSLVLFSLYS